MSAQTAGNNPPPKRRTYRSIPILGIAAILLAVLIVAAPWIVTAGLHLHDTEIGLLPTVPGVAASSDGDSFDWLLPLCISAILLAILIGAAPWIVAHTGLRDTAINSILARPSVTGSSDGASFSWFSPLSVRGLRLSSKNNRLDVRVEEITAERFLWQICFSAPDLGTLKVEKPYVLLKLPIDGQIRAARGRLEPTFRAIVRDAGLTVRLDEQEPPVIEVDNVNVTLRVEKSGETRVLTLDPVVIFERRKLSPGLATRLLHLFDPTMGDNPQISGAVSLSLEVLRVPIGVSRERVVNCMELEGKLVLHEVSTDVRNPIRQVLVQLVADMNGAEASDVVRLTQDAEIRFHVRDGRMYHEGLRIGFPDIDPGLQLTSRGSVGLDKTLDLFVELPRLDKALRKEKGPARCRITGTVGNPHVAVEDASLVLRQPDRKEPIIAADGINLSLRVESMPSGRVLAFEPVEVFKKQKLSLEVAAGLVKFLAPDVESDRQVAGEISLSFTKLRIPVGVPTDQKFKQMEAEGKITLHQVASEVKSPLWQGLIRLLAAVNGQQASNVIRVVEDSEIHFQLCDGRLHHDGQRVGFPDIDPELVITSRGSIGIDETLDLHLEMPRLLKHKRDKGSLQFHVTGTLRDPKIDIQDPPLVVRIGMARWIMPVYAWVFRSRSLSFSIRCTARCASIVRSTTLWQFFQSSWSKFPHGGLSRMAGRIAIPPLGPGPAIARTWSYFMSYSPNLFSPVRSLRQGRWRQGYQQRARAVAAGLTDRVRTLKGWLSNLTVPRR
jgi:hypothetical protein